MSVGKIVMPHTSKLSLFSSLTSITSKLSSSSSLFSFLFYFLHVPHFADNSCSKISRYQWRHEHIKRLRDIQGKHTVAITHVGCASGQVDSYVCVCYPEQSLNHSLTHILTHSPRLASPSLTSSFSTPLPSLTLPFTPSLLSLSSHLRSLPPSLLLPSLLPSLPYS